jgi:ArsR family transcriptional regulator, arsenate/arsenite/antimonite-responsive transcriptional repressor
MEMTIAVRSLSALAHAGRLSAYRLLVQAGPAGLAAGELARRLGTPANTLSTHLAGLAQAGLVAARRDGRSIIYTARFDVMAELMAFLARDCCGGAAEVCLPVFACAEGR